MNSNQIEICCGSYYDAIQAEKGKATRIELNSALALGGLTPSYATFMKTKAETNLEIIVMIRPRAGGFHYTKEDKEIMFQDAQYFLEEGADGLAFGFLDEDKTIALKDSKRMVELIHSYGKTAVFHRAFDCVEKDDQAIQDLIQIHVDRILTSGCEENAILGKSELKRLQAMYGQQIELLAGCGVNASNAKNLLQDTGILQLHSSCKDWMYDPTTFGSKGVQYAYMEGEHQSDYEVVSSSKVEALLQSIK